MGDSEYVGLWEVPLLYPGPHHQYMEVVWLSLRHVALLEERVQQIKRLMFWDAGWGPWPYNN